MMAYHDSHEIIPLEAFQSDCANADSKACQDDDHPHNVPRPYFLTGNC